MLIIYNVINSFVLCELEAVNLWTDSDQSYLGSSNNIKVWL